MIAFALIGLYVLPAVLVGIAAWQTDLFQEESLLYLWFAAFMKTSSSTLNEFHKVLFPVVSALSVVVFRTKPTRSFLALGIFVLLAFVAAVGVGVLFDMNRVRDAVSGLSEPLNLDTAHAFFARVQESLLMYLGTLLGIGVVNARGGS